MSKVSVIMGVFNIEKNIKKFELAVYSILNQTYKDIEFIICDDGSEDKTLDILSNYAKDDERIKIIENKINKGLAFSLNRCLNKATGDFIARMDDDDISELTRFEKQIEFLNANPSYALVGSNALLINDDEEWGVRKTIEKPLKKDFLMGTRFIHPSIMIKKEIILELNGYDESLRRAQDYDLFMRMYARGYLGYNIQENLIKYRENKDSYKRKTLSGRINEVRIRYSGFKQLGLMPFGLIFTVKPLIIGLTPKGIVKFYHMIRYSGKNT